MRRSDGDGPARILEALTLRDEAATEAVARLLAPVVTRNAGALLLEGPLGAGKTTLARALIRHLMQDPTLIVPSPSFTLVQSYSLPVPAPVPMLHHFDLWRLSGPEEIADLGWDEARATGAVIVEWPDRLGPLRPADALTLTLAPHPAAGPEARRVTLGGALPDFLTAALRDVEASRP